MSPLAALLAQRIRDSGPIPVEEFMAQALGHPQYGYYRTRDPLGAAGDFITAPEISQMFGELIGLWCAVVWQSLGEPRRILLAEAGPGRGTLMADALRAAAQLPAFRAAIEPHLLETSPALRACQARRLSDAAPVWHQDLDSLPADAPLLFIANEFFDALPIRQFVRRGGGWRERRVALNGEAFAFADGPAASPEAPPAAEGEIFEHSPAAAAFAARLGRRLAAQGGAALIIDYGHGETAVGETLQAVRRHAYAPVLEAPGEADLTAHVDFAALAAAAAPAQALPLATQGRFLRRLGIELRAERLARARPEQADSIQRACQRLIDAAEMGTLFKVLALTSPSLPLPPGFAPDDA
ncbi:hypothetical protein GALL_98370 [mine drainage metagenome]|uniref:Uncharacterized protein n=1 Tax=mine drainage metagenome TaxID=410659 RepID=A0A1J5T759_9ZZZZ